MTYVLFILIIVSMLIIAFPSYILGSVIAINKQDKRRKNIGELYISTENGKPICYMALDNTEILKNLHDGELIFMTVKYNSQNSQFLI